MTPICAFADFNACSALCSASAVVAFSRISFLALELLLRERELGVAISQLGLLRAQEGAIRIGAREVNGRIDLGEELSCLDRIADVRVQLLQLPRDLGAHVT